MYTGIQIKPPFFEIGPKAYLYGKKALELAQYADEMSVKYDVSIIFTPQCVDIPLLAKHTRHIHVFAQHMDAIKAGRGIGTILPEAIREAGAQGFLLNHSEKRVPLAEIKETIRRGDEVGLVSMICADTPAQAAEIARFNPNIILAESPELIGVGKREENDQQQIQEINRLVWQINPDILVLHGAGIKCGQDIYEVIKNGAQGSGSTSGILLAHDPFVMLEEMIRAARTAWDETH
ncbi:MAG: triose-phosphate isomerase [Chloroflexi bacterium]|nr:triose-phosphate isomerase [Chloroflexota bacterium]